VTGGLDEGLIEAALKAAMELLVLYLKISADNFKC
jgi:hypothetical protein